MSNYPKLPQWFDIQKGCMKKVVYKTQDAAWGAARSLGNRVYECPFCKWWHTTSLRRRRGT